MQNRRHFILGAAASLGTVSGAFGDMIRSSLGARQNQENESTVNPYVTEGLIGFWDGEWNAGLGSHDDATNVWVDLSGHGRDAVLSGTYSWGANYWHVESVSGRGLATWPAQNLGDNQTIEFVIDPIATSGYGRVIAEGQNVASPMITSSSNYSQVYVYGFGIDGGNAVAGYDCREKHLHQIVHASGGYILYYIDGLLKWSNTRGAKNSTGAANGYFANRSDYGRGIDADYFTMRRYDRVLSEDELAYNYAVDRERFGV